MTPAARRCSWCSRRVLLGGRAADARCCAGGTASPSQPCGRPRCSCLPPPSIPQMRNTIVACTLLVMGMAQVGAKCSDLGRAAGWLGRQHLPSLLAAALLQTSH